MARLGHSQVSAFARNGYIFPVLALGRDEAADMLCYIESHEARRAGRLPPSFNMKIHLLLPRLWRLVHDDRITGAIEDLIGPDILCFGTSFISKSGRDGNYVSWHQDATHWGLSSPSAVTAWLALTPSRRDNGCVRVIPGTHRAAVAHSNMSDPANMLGRKEYVIGGVEESTAVDLELEPGEMSIHHALVVHGSEANLSGARRLGFAMRYIPASTRQTMGRRNSATLVRGRDHGHFDLEAPPEDEFHPDALARHRKVLRQGMDVIYRDGPPMGSST